MGLEIIIKMNRLNCGLLALAASLALVSNASAAPIFSDNFDTDPQSLNAVNLSGNWTVSQGSVDVIGADGPYDYYPGNGNYIDLNGSSFSIGGLNSSPAFGAGTYTLTFNLGGSLGGAGGVDLPNSKTTRVSLGTFSVDITLAPGAGFTTQTFTFSTLGGNLQFTSLPDAGNPNVGNILDNVSLSFAADAGQQLATPVPAALPLFVTGLGLMGLLARRRKKKSSLAV